MASLKNTTINDTGFLQLPNGTDGQRPSPTNGMMRYNTTSGQMEVYTTAWRQLSTNYNVEVILIAGGGGGGASFNVSFGGGGGGGAGGYLQQAVDVTPGTNYSMVIGGGGGGASISAQYGTTGGNTTGFGLTARGGQGGASYQNSAFSNPSTSVGSGGGSARDSPTYGIPIQDGQGNYGGGTGDSCMSGSGGGGSGSNGFNGDRDCNEWRVNTTACGGIAKLYEWESNLGGIIATRVKVYSVYCGGQRSANYAVAYSDDNVNWTNAFTGVMDSNNATGGTGTCGTIQGTGTGNGSYGRHIYWRYTVTGSVVGHHPRTSRVWLEDAAGNQYLLHRFINDNFDDIGNYQFTVVGSECREGIWLAGGAGGSFEGTGNKFSFGNGGQLPERGGRGSNTSGGTPQNYGTPGDANSGFGGGGANHNSFGGASAGGSGIVIIRYFGPQRGSGGSVTSVNGYTIHKFLSSGTFTA